MSKDILIFSEITPSFKIADVVYELATESKKLQEKLDNSNLCAVIVNKCADYTEIAEKLYREGDLSDDELRLLIETEDTAAGELLRQRADEVRQRSYGR